MDLNFEKLVLSAYSKSFFKMTMLCFISVVFHGVTILDFFHILVVQALDILAIFI